MPRAFSVSFSAVAVTAAQDLLTIKAASGKPLRLRSARITQSSDAGDAAAEMARFTVKRAASGYTAGSGGSTITPVPLDQNTSISATCRANETTVATGTIGTIVAEDAHIANGFDYRPTPEEVASVEAGGAFIIGLAANPADSLTMSGWAILEELP